MKEYAGEKSLAALSAIVRAELEKKAEGLTIVPISRAAYNDLSDAEKQDPKRAWAIFDDPPSEGGAGGGVTQEQLTQALAAKQDALTGAPDQVVGFNEAGEAVPVPWGIASSAEKLETAQTIRTNLASTSAASFDGTEDITPGVSGTLPVANGGTGGTTAATARANLGAAPTDSPVFTGSISMGRNPGTYIGTSSFAVGTLTTASGPSSHASGLQATASGNGSHAEGINTTASDNGAHAEGFNTAASRAYSHAEGYGTTADGLGSHSEGFSTTANGDWSHAGGRETTAEYYASTAIGRFNVEYDPENNANVLGYYFVIGKGSSDTARANALRITDTAAYGVSSWNASGADYAELFEWLDGNPEQEDRCGRFVTLDGEKIRLAGPDDSFVLGVVSGNPSVVGGVYDDQWQGMYLFDVFGRPLWEDVEVPAQLDPDGQVLVPAHTEHRQALNPDYDSTQKYVPRTQRPEWDAVGLLGKLVAVDNGTCRVNGWATVGDGGLAVHSARATRYRVMSRLDATHIRILIL